MAHRRWLANQKFEHAAQQIVFQEGIDAIEDAVQRCVASRNSSPSSCRSGRWRWSWKPTKRCATPRFSSL